MADFPEHSPILAVADDEATINEIKSLRKVAIQLDAKDASSAYRLLNCSRLAAGVGAPSESSDRLYLGSLTYPLIASLPMKFTTTSTGCGRSERLIRTGS